MKKYIHTQKYHTRYSDVDFKDELKASAILTFMQEAACTSADELGFGYDVIKQKNLGFITASSYVKVLKPIGVEPVTVNTWPTPPRHVIFERFYELMNEKKETCVLACSRWCLVDWNTLKMLPGSTLSDQDYSTYNTDKCIAVPTWKVPAMERNGAEKVFQIAIANSEYDHYMHVNNTLYANYVFNCFTVELLKGKYLDSFLINYIKQTHEGDVLSFYRVEKQDNVFDIYGLNAEGEMCVSAEVSFTDR